ncbi:AbrB family transcriptional regulator [Oryzibacter oryziterrae]|uniref:AbrB family transcriptional regulator n=1 Tax=Oryzibacter oryziterrae TaxID=2766474 RepID=UPI002103B124|nr:AbrB family transcriptional regulator [Oryzibacter oryziterrae]
MSIDLPKIGSPSPLLRWLVLLVGSALLAGALEFVQLPAALLLGPMLVSVFLSTRDMGVVVPRPVFFIAQGIVGTMIGRAMPPAVFGEIFSIWPIILTGVLFVVVASNLLGWLIARSQVLPGTTAIWGASPGAATAMVIMAEAYGGDMRLVAMMQYLRVIMVASAASLVARLYLGGSLAALPSVNWFGPVDWPNFALTMAVIAAGLILSRLLRMATGPMILPMALAIALQYFGLVKIELPPLLLALCNTVIGWSIGMRFTRDILGYAARALPTMILSIAVLIAVCALFGWGLAHWANVDPLTAYLASSPGGADSVAIIAASIKVDVPFVMAMQTMRFFVVLLTGPALARFIAGRVAPAE